MGVSQNFLETGSNSCSLVSSFLCFVLRVLRFLYAAMWFNSLLLVWMEHWSLSYSPAVGHWACSCFLVWLCTFSVFHMDFHYGNFLYQLSWSYVCPPHIYMGYSGTFEHTYTTCSNQTRATSSSFSLKLFYNWSLGASFFYFLSLFNMH